MKHKGSFLEFTHQRNTELLAAFRHCIASTKHIFLPDICRRISEMPTSRFWVSEERAAAVIALMLAHRPLPKMRPNKVEMYRELYIRVCTLRAMNPDAPLTELVEIAVHSPAPKFYLTPRTIGCMLSRIRSGWFLRRLSHPPYGKSR